MIEILRTRRSIRKYEKRPIDEKSLKTLKEALLRCPSSRGINPWTFLLVDEADLLAGLSKAKEHGSGFLENAALAIVVCGDESDSDVWVEDCSIAAIVAHLTAHSLGLGSCWIQIRNRAHTAGKTAENYVRELLGIPANLRVESIISVGFPGETRTPVPAEKLQYEKIKHNRYA
ncbi:MAG: nitroreductase family protein [Deltaproteobacteria bacterium]|nr:nitroreductase family protein [Deltaproteobacteria bacterium]